MEKIIWSPKVSPASIWQLYQNDARGSVDQALVEAVGFDLLQRCRSIFLVTRREVECPRCGTIFKLREQRAWRLLPGDQVCPKPGCGWQTTAQEWHASWRHRDLLGTAAMDAMQTFLHDYPLAHSTQDRMFCIDQLIHSFHISLRTGKKSRTFANNLVEGSHDHVVALLDRLFTRPDGVNKDQWRIDIAGMYALRRGQI
jgi:hypothetical protein